MPRDGTIEVAGTLAGELQARETLSGELQKSKDTLSGDLSIPPIRTGIDDKHYEHNQLTPSATWEVEHNLKKYPAVSIVDSAGSVVVGEIEYINENKVILLFQGAFSGKAFFN